MSIFFSSSNYNQSSVHQKMNVESLKERRNNQKLHNKSFSQEQLPQQILLLF